MKARARGGVAVGLALVAGLGACAPAPVARPSVAPAQVAPSSAPAAVAPPATVPEDPNWQRARGDDVLERARLAEAEGAARLFEVSLGGGEAEAVALGALPFADDADSVLAALVRRAATGDEAARRARLAVVLEVAGRPATARDPLDAEGARAAAAMLVELAARADLDPEERALALSAARALADKGFLEAARLPSVPDAE